MATLNIVICLNHLFWKCIPTTPLSKLLRVNVCECECCCWSCSPQRNNIPLWINCLGFQRKSLPAQTRVKLLFLDCFWLNRHDLRQWKRTTSGRKEMFAQNSYCRREKKCVGSLGSCLNSPCRPHMSSTVLDAAELWNGRNAIPGHLAQSGKIWWRALEQQPEFVLMCAREYKSNLQVFLLQRPWLIGGLIHLPRFGWCFHQSSFCNSSRHVDLFLSKSRAKSRKEVL